MATQDNKPSLVLHQDYGPLLAHTRLRDEDIIGLHFSKLIVLEILRDKRRPQARCQCECGSICIVNRDNIIQKHTTSCGCNRHAPSVSRKDLTGQRFGSLVVQEMLWKTNHSKARCLCDCGKIKDILAGSLGKDTHSCGCLKNMGLRKDLTGQYFGRLMVQSMVWKKKIGWATCLCHCGKIVVTRGTTLTRGTSTSCGCSQRTSHNGEKYNKLLILETYYKEGRSHCKALCNCGKLWEGKTKFILRNEIKTCGCEMGGKGQRRTTLEHRRLMMRLQSHRRRIRKRGLPYTFTVPEQEFCLQYWHNSCAICGRQNGLWYWLVFDHFIPVTSMDCPGEIASNMIPLCHGKPGKPADMRPCCNTSKGYKDPEVWLIKALGSRKAKHKLHEIETYFALTKERAVACLIS